MKKIILCLSVLLGFTMNGQWSYNSTGVQTSTCTASGSYSTAMGNGTTASGYGSVAMGNNTSADGSRSTAMGRETIASGTFSTAMGQYTTASDFGSLSIGSYNSVNSSITAGGSKTSFYLANAAFVIGNGTGLSAKSDAFVVYFNGNATLANDLTVGGALMVNGISVGGGGLASVTETGKTGKRFSTADPLNYGDIGTEAVDLSFSNSASSTRGAKGNYSTAMGYNTSASGPYSTAMGYGSSATGSNTTAIGYYSTASNYGSTAMGLYTKATADYSTAMGYSSYAYADYSTAMGNATVANGRISTTMGNNTSSYDYASLSIGSYNSVNSSITTGGSATAFNAANAAFVIGNGTASNAKSDAFVVYFNGNATLAGDLTINSDARLKDNIQPLGSTLDKLHQIEGKTYTFLKDEKHTPKIGVLAQEVQSVFPELVSEGADGILSVNYQGLVPVLINAINEQEAKIAALEAQNEQLAIASQKIAALEEMVRFLAVQQSQATSSVASN